LDENSFLITPSGFRKEEVEPEELIKCNLKGEKIEGRSQPSSENLTHARIYSLREDVNAIIHAHCTYSVACSINDFTMEPSILPEVALTVGPIPISKYVTPGTEEMANEVAGLIKDNNCLILKRHGVITTGETMQEAFNRLELVEHAANITYLVKQYGEVPPLHREDIKRLIKSAHKRGINILKSFKEYLE
jgi:L-fuculose-phosphate aldolase